MRVERSPEIIKLKETKETGEPPFMGVNFFEPPSVENRKRTEKEISEYKEKLKEFKEPFSFIPNEARETALGMLKLGKFEQEQVIKLIENPDFVVRDRGIDFLDELEGLSGKNIDRLETVLKERKWKGKDRDLAEKIKEKIEEFRKEGVDDKITAKERHLSTEESAEAIEKLKHDLGDIGDKPWAYLYPKEEENIKAIKELIVNMAEKGGEKAIPALTKFSQDKNSYVAWLAAQMLARIITKTRGENALEETFRGHDKKTKKAVDFEKKQMMRLLTTKERFLATGDREKLIEGLLGLKKIFQQLKEKWGDKIIGIAVGAGGGYFTEGLSDIDFAIIAKEEAIKEMFDEDGSKIPSIKIEGVADFHERFVSINEQDAVIPFNAIQYLFSGSGLFLGDEQRLNQIQKSTLEKLNEDKWDAVRKIYIDDEIDAVEKMGLRFGINEKNLDKLRQTIFLNDVPPTREETLEIVREKEKMLSKAKI